MDRITDDRIWMQRGATLEQMARGFGQHRDVMREILRDRDFKPGLGGTGGRFDAAPCRDCGEVFEVDGLTDERLCKSCLSGETEVPELTDALIDDRAQLLRRERIRVRGKRARLGEREWDARYAPVGGPETRTMRVMR